MTGVVSLHQDKEVVTPRKGRRLVHAKSQPAGMRIALGLAGADADGDAENQISEASDSEFELGMEQETFHALGTFTHGDEVVYRMVNNNRGKLYITLFEGKGLIKADFFGR